MPAPLNWYSLAETLADVSAASAVRFVIPRAGYLRRVDTALGGAITTADAVVTVSVDNSALSPTITIANASSAENDHDFAEYFAPVKAGSVVEVASGGQSDTTQPLSITITLSE
jgi:hypothetical protein